jgi:hypothetical protein
MNRFALISQTLGLPDPDFILEQTCGRMREEDFKLISEAEILALEEKYHLLGQYLPQTLQARNDLEKDEARKTWIAAAAFCFPERSIKEVRRIPLPASDGSLAGDMAPLFVLLPQVETAAADYRAHGFSEEEIIRFMKSFEGGLGVGEKKNGQPGINKTYYAWICRYAKASLFRVGGLNFEFTDFSKETIALKNIHTGEIVMVMRNYVFNENGLPIESAGQYNPKNAFAAAFATLPDAYYGYPVRNIRCVNELTAFPKEDWKILAQAGDPMLGIHIPRGADISAEATRNAFAEALAIVKKWYPERKIHGLFCSSWLLDPVFDTMLPEGSRIRQFGSVFIRYPRKSGGDSVFSFVFPKKVPFEELPEDTSLQRALKKYYLDGKFVTMFGGFVPCDEE